MRWVEALLGVGAAAIVAVAAPAPAAGGSPEIAVIANPQVPIEEASAAKLNAIFTTRTQRWDDGTPIRPLNFPARDDLRVAFDRAVLGLEPDEVARFWIDRRVRGGNPPPRQVPNARLMVGVVGKLDGAIGYVPAKDATGAVRVVARVRGGRVVGP